MITETQINCKHEWEDLTIGKYSFLGCQMCGLRKIDWELYLQGVNYKNAEWLARIDGLLIELDEWEENAELLVRTDKEPYVLETPREAKGYFMKELEKLKSEAETK